MEYRVIFDQTVDGDKPVADFLNSRRGKNDALHKLVAAGILKLKNRDNH